MNNEAFDLAEVAALISRRPRPRREEYSSDIVGAGVELREYLLAAMTRPRASNAKVAMGLTVLDIWRRTDETEYAHGYGDGGTAASIASLGAALISREQDIDGASDIVRECRGRIESSITPGSEWDSIWRRATNLGLTIGFFIEEEAARADRLWAAILRLAAPGVRIELGVAPLDALASLAEVDEGVRATGPKIFDAVRSGMPQPVINYSRQPNIGNDGQRSDSVPPVDGLFTEESKSSEVPDWKSLGAAEGDDGAKRIRVWFGTNREPISRQNRRSPYSGQLATGELFYGVCQVNIPKPEQPVGGSWPFVSAWLRCGIRKGHPKVESYFRFDGAGDFLSALGNDDSNASSERTALVFLHGYATNFTEAATAAARISLNIKHQGPTAMFSWASKGRKNAYRLDERTIDLSRRGVIEFLETLTGSDHVDNVDVIVHSLGNRLFLRSLVEWFKAPAPSSIPLRNIYLAAPDIDLPEFRAESGVYARAATKTTHYCSDSDSALLASRILHRGVPRAGLMPPIETIVDIDTIETSGVDLSQARHSYVIESAAVRADIFGIQSGLVNPVSRANINPGGSSLNPDYWRLA